MASVYAHVHRQCSTALLRSAGDAAAYVQRIQQLSCRAKECMAHALRNIVQRNSQALLASYPVWESRARCTCRHETGIIRRNTEYCKLDWTCSGLQCGLQVTFAVFVLAIPVLQLLAMIFICKSLSDLSCSPPLPCALGSHHRPVSAASKASAAVPSPMPGPHLVELSAFKM